MTLASRIGVMDRGEIVQVGTPTEIYEYPSTQVRRRLHRLGEHVRGPPDRGRAGSRAHPVRRAGRDDLRGPRHQRARRAPSVWAAIRPEKIDISSAQPPAAEENIAHGVGQGDRLHGRHVDVPGEDRHRQDGARDAAQHRTRHADDAITWDETVYLQLACVESECSVVTCTQSAAVTSQRGVCSSAQPPAGSVRQRPGRGSAVVRIPIWLLLFFLVPFLIVLKISFSERRSGDAALRAAARMGRRTAALQIKLNFGNYLFLFDDPLYVSAYPELDQGGGHLHAVVPAVGYPWPTPSRAPTRRRATCC